MYVLSLTSIFRKMVDFRKNFKFFTGIFGSKLFIKKVA